MARHKPPPEGKVGRIDRESMKQKAADRIKEYYDQQIRRPTVKGPERRPVERGRPDRFRPGSSIPRFLRSVQERQKSSWLYQSFTLAGTNYLVRDMRSREAREAAASRSEAQQAAHDDKLLSEKAKKYINYLGDRSNLMPKTSSEAAKEITRLLSEFEKLLVERFEKGKTIEQQSADGKPHFKLKTLAQWRSFFAKFLKRTIWKKGELLALKQFIYRGLVEFKKGSGKYAMLIGDMIMADGQVEKFARLKVLSDLSNMLANAEPGSTLEAELLRKGIDVGELRYLALAHKHGEDRVKTGMEATKGMFGQLKAEEQAAEQLGLKRGRKRKGYGGPIKWGEGGEEEKKHAFVPWGFWEREERKGKPLPITAIIIAIIAFMIIAAIWAIMKYL